MYASSILGWLGFLDRRISEIQNQSPVSQSAVIGQHTEACHLALLELTEQLESFSGSVVVDNDECTNLEATKTVLEHIRRSGRVMQDTFDSRIANVVEESSNLRVVGGFVLVPINMTDHGFNVCPAINLVANWIEDLFRDVRTILKFLKADGTPQAERWMGRWQSLGALLKDIHSCCKRLLRQIDFRDQMTESVSQYTGTTDDVVETKLRNTND